MTSIVKKLAAIRDQKETIQRFIDDQSFEELEEFLAKRDSDIKKIFENPVPEREKKSVLAIISSILEQDERFKGLVEKDKTLIAKSLVKLRSQKSAIKAYTTDHE